MDKRIDCIVTDKDDIKIISENLEGLSYRDNPSCGFSQDISVIFNNGQNNIILCPANDSCSIARIGNTNRYINIKDREALETILRKYGMKFPCI